MALITITIIISASSNAANAASIESQLVWDIFENVIGAFDGKIVQMYLDGIINNGKALYMFTKL
jgi:flagellar biosynthesis protein FliR